MTDNDRPRDQLLAQLVELQQRLARAEADRSERQRAEAFLRSALKQLRDLEATINRSPAVVIVWRATAGMPVEFISDNIEQFGHPADDLMSGRVPWRSIVHPDDYPRVESEATQHHEQSVAEFTLHYRLVTPPGDVRWVENRIRPLRDSRGRVTHFQGIMLDITERRSAEEALAAERNLLRTLIDSLPVTVYVKDAESRFILGNQAVAHYMGAQTPDDLLGKTDFDFYPRELAERYYADERQVIESVQPIIGVEEQSVNPDGTLRWALTTKVPLRDGQGKVIGLVGIGQDITQRKCQEEELARYRHHLEEMVQGRTAALTQANQQLTEQVMEREQAEAALSAERNLLRTLIDNMPDAIYVKDRDGRFLVANKWVATLMGTTPDGALGKTDFDFYPRELAERFYADEQVVVQSGQPVVAREEPVRDAAGNLHWYLTTKVPLCYSQGQVVGVVGIGRDISERRRSNEERERLQAQFLQAQKMEAIGRLTAGVAHDFNNLLTVINGYAQRLQTKLTPDDPLQASAKKILDASARAAELVHRLMVFSRSEAQPQQTVGLDQVMDDLDAMLRPIIGEDILLNITVAPDVWQIALSPAQVGHVIANLTVNARDAMPGGGQLTIEAANAVLDEEYVRGQVNAKPGDYVRLTVRDAGTGMTEEVLAHLFEPYFTTKAPGEGSGLGLSTVYGIVRQAGGHIQVRSTPGQGTTFDIYLPRVETAPTASGPAADDIG
jgi:two-component system cell cycle sensor histidine kinase/response regulator CckA